MVKSRVTLADVAREAGVSMQTVSRVVNAKGEISPATRQLVNDVIDRLGYRPSGIARSLATNRTLTFGLVVPDISNPFFPEIARGAEDVARAHGYTVFVCNTVEDPQREDDVLRLLEDRRVDGLLLCSSRLPDDTLLARLAAFPAAVVVNRTLPPDIAGSVRVDDALGAARAVEHLLSRGRRTIALIAGPASSRSSSERLRGFQQASAAAGRDLDLGLIEAGRPDLEGGLQAATHLLTARPDIDGIVCYNDLVAIGALQACAALGRRVPDDVAIVGCDDIVLAALVSPSVTTLRVAKDALGAAAATMLLERLDGRFGPELVITPELIVRQSAP